MQEELLKQKYLDLQGKVKYIRNQIDELNGFYDELSGIIKEGILVNDDLVYFEGFKLVKGCNDRVLFDINNTLLPSISNKI